MTSVITPGIVLPTMPISDADRNTARQQFGLPQGRPCILFVANDFRKKGLSVLINTLRVLPEQVILAVVGHSAQLPGFRQQAETAGLVSRVFFLGALADVGPAYRAADCLAHPTLEDTFAMVVLEAMAHGLPVVVSTSKYCGVAGLLANDLNAMILDDPRDTHRLGEALNLLLDPDVSARLGREARAFAEKFEWGGIAAQQEKLYYAAANALRAQDGA
jgi:UDP-glucose:(heptosyl)LPS alpha-1,3-glucosyltransferase